MNRNKIIKILNLFKDSNNCVPYERFEKVADMILSPTYGLPDSVPLDSGLREEKLLFDSLSEFVFKTFPDASSNSHLKKLKLEADEAMQNNKDCSEYADCLMAVYGATAKAGFSFYELINAGFEKLEINKTRKWQRLADGTYQHI